MLNHFTTHDDTTHAETIPPVGEAWPENHPPKPTGFYALRPETKLKVAVSVCLDLLDLGIGWMPGVGHAYEFVAFAISCGMWGKAGVWSAWEIIEFTNMIDTFIPTNSLIAWYCAKQELAEG